MRTTYCWIVKVTACLTLLSACKPIDPSIIGWITVDGPEGFLNGTPLKDRDHLAIHSGDHVTTGSGTGIKIDLRGWSGTYIQLDENTDPDLIKEAQCVLLRLVKGQIFAQGTGLCFDTPDMAGSVGSEIVLSVQPTKAGATRSILSVLVGHVTLTGPVAMQVTSGQQVTVSRALAPRPQTRSLTPDEIRELTSWRFKHKRLVPVAINIPATTPSPPGPTPPPLAPAVAPPAHGVSPNSKAQVEQGWCCLGGKVQKDSSLQCAASKGVFYTSEAEVRTQCVIVQ